MTDEPRDRRGLPNTQRVDPPRYLATYLDRQKTQDPTEGDSDESLPLYLRRFRQRQGEDRQGPTSLPLEQRDIRPNIGHGMQKAMSEDNRTKEISAPPHAKKAVVADVYLIRHGETQGYSTESGLTPLGTWQAHTYGHTVSKRVSPGETIVLRHADTNRARETAQNIERGLQDGLAMFDKDVKVLEPEPMEEFRNFGVATPEGIRDVTAAFRKYYSTLEQFERTALGDRPLWLVEIDRFWRTQQGGADPIQHWLQIPMLHFEPPVMCIRRFWTGIQRLAHEHPGARMMIATHSGPIRAFAVAALGYDPGEPYNTEHVRIKVFEGGTEALVSYRNRVQEIHVPQISTLPTWQLDEAWVPPRAGDQPMATSD
ncbi:histidine phosphatase family protein [Nocardioides agariphilus]|jgi:broad specificity phosphatase PhoE|uniref:Histidine phosphatase family protein n=1 Tax=Nocardioides agariphilus TaxID=433664 RepID=A0A930YPJ9_9ACTN|nr:histidine phosphatase family protein [Nocardioides agariphilus]MBF4767775.1 histidine phosphatase family protein [Nocardioides agariphilus]